MMTPFFLMAMTVFNSPVNMLPCTQTQEFRQSLFVKGFSNTQRLTSSTGESLALYRNPAGDIVWVFEMADGTTCEVKK